MNKDYLDSIDRAMARERAFMLAMQETALAGRLLGVRRQLGSLVRNVSCTDDLPQMIASEKLIVERDLEFHANSKGMVSSLTTALNEIRAIEQHITMVDDPVQYRVVNRAYSLPKNCRAGLPMDEARQALASHQARLGNMDKSRLDDEEKGIIDARRAVMQAAGRLYAARQSAVLGVLLRLQGAALCCSPSYVTGVLIRMVMRSWPVIREHGLGSGGGLLFWETCFMTVSNDRRKQ